MVLFVPVPVPEKDVVLFIFTDRRAMEAVKIDKNRPKDIFDRNRK